MTASSLLSNPTRLDTFWERQPALHLSRPTPPCRTAFSISPALVERPRILSADMPQESGSVNALREAIIEIRFAGGYNLECVIDTGFDGALVVPVSVAQRLGLSVVARLVFELVGGARMSADVALGEVEWLGQQRIVEVILSEGNDALIGTEMFEGAKLIVDYANRLITISR